MAAVRLTVDDVNPLIFSSGEWDYFDNFQWAFNNTRSLTRRAGAYKVVRFIGTSITVYGGVQPIAGTINDTSSIKAQFSIDDGAPTVYAPTQNNTQYVRVTYYQSPTLSMGEHVLTMTNMAENDLIWLDYFVIPGVAGGPDPVLLQSDGARKPQIPALQSAGGITDPGPLTGSAVTAGDTPIIGVAGSPVSPDPPNISPAKHTKLTSTAAVSSTTVPSVPSAPVTTYQSTIINAYNSQTPPKRNDIPAIVSGICSAFLLTILVLLLFGLYRRRHRKQDLTISEDTVKPYYITQTTEQYSRSSVYKKRPFLLGGSGGRNNNSTTPQAAPPVTHAAVKSISGSEHSISYSGRAHNHSIASSPQPPFSGLPLYEE